MITIDNLIIKYEDEYIKNNIKNYEKIQHIYTPIHIPFSSEINKQHGLQSNSITIHSLYVNQNSNKNLVLVHGTAGSCMSYISLVDSLILNSGHNIYILDLPGFGRTHINTDKDLGILNSDFYLNVLDSYIKTLHLNNVVLCGHSFGAYICTKYVGLLNNKTSSLQYIEDVNISKLILISPAGIFPTMGSYGFYWSLFFKFTFVRYFEIFFYFIISQLIKYYVNFCSINGTDIGGKNFMCDTTTFDKQKNNMFKTLYWLYLLSHPKSIGSLVISNNIELTKDGSYWNDPTFDYLKKIKCPIFLIYGSEDSLVPSHQGQFLNKLLNYELFIVPNEGHNPMESSLLPSKIVDFLTKSNGNNRKSQNQNTQNFSLSQNKQNYQSTFDINQTNNIIKKLYKDLGYKN